MGKAARADSKRCGNPAAPSELHTAAGDIGGVGPRRNIEQKRGNEEESKIMNANTEEPSQSPLALTRTTACPARRRRKPPRTARDSDPVPARFRAWRRR